MPGRYQNSPDAKSGRKQFILLVGITSFGIIMAGATYLSDPISKMTSDFGDKARRIVGFGATVPTVVSVNPGHDTDFTWVDMVYLDGRTRRVRFEKAVRASVGLSARRKIVTDYDRFGRMVQEQDGTEDGRNLNIYRFVYADSSRDAPLAERHDLYVFYDGSADTADQYAGNILGLVKGRSAIAGTFSGELAAFLAVPEKPEVTQPAVAAAVADRR
jgi:hypothetical protein